VGSRVDVNNLSVLVPSVFKSESDIPYRLLCPHDPDHSRAGKNTGRDSPHIQETLKTNIGYTEYNKNESGNIRYKCM